MGKKRKGTFARNAAATALAAGVTSSSAIAVNNAINPSVMTNNRIMSLWSKWMVMVMN